jgi:hypothetical protein
MWLPAPPRRPGTNGRPRKHGRELALSDPAACPDFECSGLQASVLHADRTCALVVRFRPRSPDLIAGEVQVVDDAAGSPHALLCSGTALATPLLVAESQGASYRGQPVGTSGETRQMRFTNDGTAVMNVADVIGAQAADFSVAPGPLPAAVPPEGAASSRSVSVPPRPACGPPSCGSRPTRTRAPTCSRSTGSGALHPVMTIDPTVLTFPPGPVGGPSVVRRVTLVNNGQAPIPIVSVEVLGDEFTVRGGDCVPGAVVPVGGSCGVDLVVSPAAAGGAPDRCRSRRRAAMSRPSS